MSGKGRTSPFRGEGGKVWNRRIFPVPAGSGEGPFTEPTSAAQPWRRQPLLMPHSRHCRHQSDRLARTFRTKSQAQNVRKRQQYDYWHWADRSAAGIELGSPMKS
jgi:hypothetical protein